MQIQDQAVIHAPVEVVWDVTTDVRGLPDVTSTITRPSRSTRCRSPWEGARG
jgi:hypothetical protein